MRVEDAAFDPATGSVRARRARRLGRIVLSEGPGDRVSPEAAAEALVAAVRERGLDVLPMEGAAQVRGRVAVLRGLEGGDWPDWSDAALMETLDAWLAPAAAGRTRLDAIDPGEALAATLDYALRRRLDTEAPSRRATPAGSDIAIDYCAEGGPAWAVRLQELFGMAEHPRIAGGRVALVVVLLSPAHRPIQTTRDLPGFWRASR